MRKKIFDTLNKIYGILMTISFFAGFIPFLGFVFAIIIGGEIGEATAIFLHKQYYPWVILLGSIAIVIGVIAMYIGKIEGLSLKNVSANKVKDK